MVKTAQNRAIVEGASLRPCCEVRRSQRQAPVRAVPVIVGDELAQDRLQVPFVQDDQVVEAGGGQRPVQFGL